MLHRRLALVMIPLLTGAVRGAIPADYTGANGNWNTGANWSINPVVPINSGPNTYDVTITGKVVSYNVPGSNAVQSLGLSGSTLTLALPDNLAVGGLVSSASTINTQNSAFSVTGTISMVATSLLVNNGGALLVPGLTAYSTSAAGGGTFQANGSTTHLLLTNLTAIQLNQNGLTARAQGGGDVELNALTSIAWSGSIFEGTTFLATGTGSTFRANSLPALTMNGASFTVQAQSNALAEMTALATVSNSGSIFGNFNAFADGAGSKVRLPALTTINLNGAGDTLRATAGGDLEAPLLSAVTASGSIFEGLTLSSSGAGSLVNVAALGSAPQTELNVTVQGGGTIQWGSPTSIRDSSITIDGSGTLNTSSLTNIDSTSLTAVNGSALSIPVAAYASTPLGAATWTANGTGSKLLLPNLTSVALAGNDLTVQAQNGGDVELAAVTNVTATGNTFHLHAIGAGSVVNAPLLPATLSHMEVAVTSGTIQWGAPVVLQSSSVTIDTGGVLNLAALKNVDSTSFTASNSASISVPLVTIYNTVGGNGATMTANAGSHIAFPALVSVSNPGGSIFGSYNVNANGAGALVSFPSLTTINLNGANNGFQATGGGDIEMPALVSVTNSGGVFDQFSLTSNSGGVINAPLLGGAPINRVAVSINGGTINWGNPTALRASSVTIDTSGTIALAALVNIDSTSFNAANGVSITLPNVTAISAVTGTGATLQTSGSNSHLSLPALTSVTNPGNVFNSVTFRAAGAGSTVVVPLLSSVTVSGASVTFQAQAGGTMHVDSLVNESNQGSIFGNFNAYADDAGSKLTMNGLVTMHLNGAGNTLRATGGGDLEMTALTGVTATSSVFNSVSVQSNGPGSLVNFPNLRSTLNFPDTLSLANFGELDLGGLATPFSFNFMANFAANSTGNLDIYVNHALFTSIAPNNAGTYNGYSFTVPAFNSGGATVDFIANGAAASVTLQDYNVVAAVPEPASVLLAGTGILAMLARRRAKKCRHTAHGL